jgi:hypothetical protein
MYSNRILYVYSRMRETLIKINEESGRNPEIRTQPAWRAPLKNGPTDQARPEMASKAPRAFFGYI